MHQKVLGDGAYDRAKIYRAVRSIGAYLIAPPARNARQQKKLIDYAKLSRDHAIAQIKMLGGNDEARK